MRASLSIVIPAYGEEKRLPGSLERIAAYLRDAGFSGAEVLVVDDGSADRTAEVAREAGRALVAQGVRFDVLENPGNRGKGYSVRHGLLASRHEWALFTDADLSAPIEECDKLLEAVAGGKHDVAIGSRAVDRSLIGERQPILREGLGRLFNRMVRVVAGLPFADTQCGFKLFSRVAVERVFRDQRLDRFGFDVELLYLARKRGLRVAEVPVRWDNSAETKVGLLGGADAFLDVFRVRWNDLRGRYGS